ncbi:MAG: alpha/beta hydrolase fold domain-containing protein, partial [Terriglobia bacterium]
RRAGLSLPAALGIFSGTGDMSQPGDSRALYTIWGFSGYLKPPSNRTRHDPYIGAHDPKDPVLSPVYADLRGFPPALFVTATRDLLLSAWSKTISDSKAQSYHFHATSPGLLVSHLSL